MIISQKIQDAINEQINKEFYSEYLYLAMAAYFYGEGLNGFGNFFIKQAEEEREHAMKFFHFLYERRGEAALKAIEKPKADFSSIEQIFEMALEHEEFVTKSIYELLETAEKEKDHATASFLKWYVDEQVEEEASMEEIVQKIKMAQGNPGVILMLDAKLGERK
jgi:ferritin